MNNWVRIEQVDDGSFIIECCNLRQDTQELPEPERRTAPNKEALKSVLDEVFSSIFKISPEDEFSASFDEASEKSKKPKEEKPKTAPKIIKDVDDTPLSEMTPLMYERNKGKRIR